MGRLVKTVIIGGEGVLSFGVQTKVRGRTMRLSAALGVMKCIL